MELSDDAFFLRGRSCQTELSDDFLSAEDEASLSLCLSPKNGEGSASMKTFIRQRFMGILKPVNENILALQEQAQQLEKNVAERELREGEHRQWLIRHDEELSAQRQELGNLARGASELRSGLQEAGQRHEELQAEAQESHRLTREALGRGAAVDAEMEVIRKCIATSDAIVLDMQSRADRSYDQFCRNEIILLEMKESHVGLQNRHMDLAQGYQQCLLTCEDAHQRAIKVSSRLDTQKAEVGNAIVAINDRAFDCEKHLDYLRDEVEGMNEITRRLDDNVGQVLSDVGALTSGFDAKMEATQEENKKNLEHAQQQQKEADMARQKSVREAMSVGQRISNVETQVATVTQGHAVETEKNIHNRNVVEELAEQVPINTAAIEQQTATCLELQGGHLQMDELLQVVDARTKKMEVSERELLDRAKGFDQSLMLLSSFRDEAAKKMDNQALELHVGKTRQDQFKIEMIQANETLEGLGNDFATTNIHLGSVSESVSLAHEYFDGLGKGIQDLHRNALSATPTGGMLPSPPRSPKKQKGGSLPEISGRGSP